MTHMGAFRTSTILTLIILNAATALFMETKMTNFYQLEILILLSGLFASLVLIVLLAVDAEIAWPAAILYFSLAIANNIFLYSTTQHTPAFLIAVVLNLFGFLISTLSSTCNNDSEDYTEPSHEPTETAPPVETYDIKEPIVTHEPEKKQRSRKKKSEQ